MNLDKLNDLLNRVNHLHTLDVESYESKKGGTYYLGEKYFVNYYEIKKDVLNEITNNLYMMNPQAAKLYFFQIIERIDEAVENKNQLIFFSEEAKDDYRFEFETIKLEEMDEEDEFDEESVLNDIGAEIKYIIKRRFRMRLNIIQSLKSQIIKIQNVYFEIPETQTGFDEDEKEEIGKIINDKLEWNGSPAVFGFLINQLINNGWINKPTKHYKKDADYYLNLFNIKTTPGTLAKEINPKAYSLSKDHEKMFRIPHIDKI